MDFLGLLISPGPRKILANEYGNLEVDAVLDETHEWKNEVTMNPVETGSPVSDHIVLQPDSLRVRAFISNQTTSLSANFMNSLNIFAPKAQSKTQTAFDFLYDAMKARTTFSVYTKNRLYSNMVLQTVTIPRTPANGDALEVAMEFVEIRKVETRIVDIPDGIGNKKAGKGTTRKADAGKDAGKKSAETVSKPSSVLSRVFN